MGEFLFPEDWLGGEEAAPQDEEEDVQEEEVQEEEVHEEEEEVVEEQEEALEEEALDEEAVQEEEAQDEVEEAQENEDLEAAPHDEDADMDDELAAMEAAACAQWVAAPSEPAKKPEQRRLGGVAGAAPWRQVVPHPASKGSEKGATKGFEKGSGCLKGKSKGKEKGSKGMAMGKGNGIAKGPAKGKEKGAAKGMAVKRPLSPADWSEGAPLAKRPVAQNTSVGNAAAQTSAAGAAAGPMKVKLKRPVAEKLEMLKGKGIKLGASAVQALALAEPRDAQILLSALAKKSGEIANPTKWVEISLERRAGTAPAAATDGQQSAKAPVAKAVIAKSPAAKAPVTKAPVAKSPVAKSPVAKAPAPPRAMEVPKAPAASKLPAGVKVIKLPGQKVFAPPQEAKAPIAKTPVAKAPITKAPVGKAPGPKAGGKAQSPGLGTPPRMRTEQELEFFQMAVQAKLMALNKQGIWKGPHPLDEAALVALLSIDSARALEILDEAEEQGKQLASPSRFVRDQCAEEEQV